MRLEILVDGKDIKSALNKVIDCVDGDMVNDLALHGEYKTDGLTVRAIDEKSFLTDDIYAHLSGNNAIKPTFQVPVYNLEYEMSKYGGTAAEKGDDELDRMELIEKRVRNNIVDNEIIAKLDSILK